ncbi:MAG: DinB family protein [Candidatus Hodarchaeales archaeon]|jgi:uncharacterized damage-inducible protein DinB
MVLKFLLKAIDRHFEENRLLLNQLTDDLVISEPVTKGRPLGEIFLHMIRSFEFYSRGVAMDIWEPLPYNLETFRTVNQIKILYKDVVTRSNEYLKKLTPTMIEKVIKTFNRPASKVEFLLEMLEHSIQHRGQIIVYYRLIGLEPAVIPYLC